MTIFAPMQWTVRSVALDKIVVDPRVQRAEGLNRRHLDNIVAHFDPKALGTLVVSHRADGSYVILDGMHRLAAAMRVSWDGEVNSLVFDDLTIAEEASLFLLYNNKKDPTAISRFKARVVAQDEVAVAMDHIAYEHGWVIRQDSSAGSLAGVKALERVYRNGSGTLPDGAYPELTGQVLFTITEAWGHQPIAVHNAILGGVGQLYGRFESAVDTQKLIHEMEKIAPRELVGKAVALRDLQRGTVQAALAKLLVGLHNKSRRTNLLPEWVWTR